MSLLHQLALKFVPGIGDVLAKNLISYCGSAEEIFKTSKHKLLQIPGIGPKMATAFLNKECFVKAENEIRFIERNKVKAIFYTDAAYPKRLKSCIDAPVMLFFKGNADLNKQRVISIVGTRNATAYGKQLCDELIGHLKKYGATIVSGLAYGIDICAHKACVKQTLPTVGILAHGLDRVYPSQHTHIAEKMMENGGLLTEFPSQTNPERENFPKRNRIIAGMADATVVVEASIKGGALITAEIANSYNRDVFTFPGRIGDEFSEGCNFLVRFNKAGLLTGYSDLAEQLGWLENTVLVKKQQLLFPLDLTTDEKTIFEMLQLAEQTGIDDLSIQTNLPVSILAMNLLNLEMQGLVRSLPGKSYTLIK
ncbi:DNA-processing protein DprA [Mucilaginibacter arboris]|uniref:DNA-protecting protein DprA n=1 Tax=Mucilaginibacter arboris TaxID=2682090 RepID=A0A7K1SY96_9SPHI|nr:DNA-processing protein DprA [Mucilaginibacter arboris]MVN22295.1 DNA-protecting protein DprA [Mucilaginibacter arboris]